MGTPLFAFRLPAESARQLRELAKLYNGGNASGLLRDMVGALVSGEPAKIGAFNSALMAKMGEQLALDFVAKAEAEGRKRVAAARRKKGGRRRARQP